VIYSIRLRLREYLKCSVGTLHNCAGTFYVTVKSRRAIQKNWSLRAFLFELATAWLAEKDKRDKIFRSRDNAHCIGTFKKQKPRMKKCFLAAST
jgi:hypothetical protein